MTTHYRLLMIGNYLSTGKWNKNVWHYLAERLSQRGWEVTTTSSKENRFLRLIDMLWTAWKERERYDLVQIDVFSGKAFIYAEACTWLLRKLKKPVVLTLHGGKLPKFSDCYPNHVQYVIKYAAAVVTPSAYIQSALIDFRPDIQSIPNAIDLSSAKFRLRERASPTLIWVRAFHHIYNPSLIPKVIKSLEGAYPEIEIMMLGPDKNDGSLGKMMTLARELDVSDKINVVGSVSHTAIPEWLDKADIFINTTNYDNAPSSVIEAMANGLCVVSTNVGGIPYLLEDGVNALLVRPNNPEAMAKAIRRILVEPEISAMLSANARTKAEAFDWPIVLPQWEKVFTNLLQK